MAFNIHGDESKIGGYTTGTKYRTDIGKRNFANTNRYKLNDYEADKRFKTTAARPTPRGGTMQIPMGGFGGGRGTDFTEEDLRRQEEYDKMIWERSTPNIHGVGGSVNWNRETNTIESTLSDENQAIYDAAYKRQGMFGGLADAMAGGGWQDMQQQRFDQKRALYAESDAREEAIRKANQYATGASTTGMYEEDARVAGNLNQRNMMLEEAAFNESQGLLDSNLTRQNQAVGMMSNLGNIPNNMIQYPSPNTPGNMANVSTASTRWADELNMKQFKKQKGKSDFFSSLLGSLFG